MVRPFEHPLLLDENITRLVGHGLVARGCDVVTMESVGLIGATDDEVLAKALEDGRVVVTHDSDFGTLAVRDGRPLVGIIYLRPGHIDANEVLRQIDAIRAVDIETQPPFILVAERRGGVVRTRLRQWSPTTEDDEPGSDTP